MGVFANMISATAAMVYWTASLPTPDGYEVFYQLADGGDILSGGTSNNTELTLTGLTLGETYSIFAVAFGSANNNLPSPRSNTVIIQASKNTSLCMHVFLTNISQVESALLTSLPLVVTKLGHLTLWSHALRLSE